VLMPASRSSQSFSAWCLDGSWDDAAELPLPAWARWSNIEFVRGAADHTCCSSARTSLVSCCPRGLHRIRVWRAAWVLYPSSAAPTCLKAGEGRAGLRTRRPAGGRSLLGLTSAPRPYRQVVLGPGPCVSPCGHGGQVHLPVCRTPRCFSLIVLARTASAPPVPCATQTSGPHLPRCTPHPGGAVLVLAAPPWARSAGPGTPPRPHAFAC